MSSGQARNEDLTAAKLFDVSHVTAVVTGGGTGIGLMITQALVANRAKVYIVGRREEPLQAVTEQYNTGPGQIIPLQCDISSKPEVENLAQDLAKREPDGIQLLVNNAGVARDQATAFSATGGPPAGDDAAAISRHFLASEPDRWAETFATNVTGQFFVAMALLPLLARGGTRTPGYSSSVVVVSSTSGFLKSSSGGQFAYACSKAAVTHLSRMLASEFVGCKVRVNCIAPGVFPSEMTAGGSGDNQKSELDMEPSNPAGRHGTDSDMAATILFLAGKGGVFYNSAILTPGGGNTLVNPAAI